MFLNFMHTIKNIFCICFSLGDPEPPLDEDVRIILENYDQGPAPVDGNTAGFAKRRLIIQQFFT